MWFQNIPFQSSVSHTIEPRNHPSMLENYCVVDRIIASELTLGRIAGPFLLHILRISYR